jgi:septal ring factor EnvC (AmiA/AmiB activator)
MPTKQVQEQEGQVKFSEEDLEKIKVFQQRYLDIQMGYGQIQISRSRLEQQFTSLDEAHDTLNENLIKTQSEERSFIEEINKEYGDGVLNPETGVFTPSDKA